MRIKASIKTVSLSAATVAVAICAQAHAQDAGSASSSRVLTDDDIIVTARKLTETVTDVPATINVVTAEDLASRRLGSGLDLNGLVPGFQLYNAIGGAASPTIRGLGSNTAVFSIEASVASFIDGVYAAHPRDLVSPIFDIERVKEIGRASCRERVC